MQYALTLLFVASIACFIDGKYTIGSVLIGILIIILIGLSGNKKLVNLKARLAIPKLTKSFDTYGKFMADYKMYTANGPQYGWVMPGREAIKLVDQFLRLGRPDIPIEMLCEGIEGDFKAYDKCGGMTPILDQKMEARLRLLSAIAQLTNSDHLKNKISRYKKEAESRKVRLKDGIITNPLPSYMI